MIELIQHPAHFPQAFLFLVRRRAQTNFRANGVAAVSLQLAQLERQQDDIQIGFLGLVARLGKPGQQLLLVHYSWPQRYMDLTYDMCCRSQDEDSSMTRA